MCPWSPQEAEPHDPADSLNRHLLASLQQFPLYEVGRTLTQYLQEYVGHECYSYVSKQLLLKIL